MLFLVLAAIILAFYLIRRFSSTRSLKGKRNLINVIAVHHLSPKEKLVLLKVMDETILVGVTPQNISKISDIPANDHLEEEEPQTTAFSELLSGKIKQSFSMKSRPKKETLSHEAVAGGIK